jgi:hypothetical protein
MAVYVHNLTINQGSDFAFTFDVEGTKTNAPKSLVGYAASAQLRKSYGSSTKVAFATTVIDAEGGSVRISLDSSETADIKAGRYVYDVYINNPSENVRIVEGTALVRAGVTR